MPVAVYPSMTVAEIAAIAPLAATDHYLRGEITAVALDLDRAMAADPEARARYQEIWGMAWVPLIEAAIDSLDLAPVLPLAVGTPTCVASPKARR